MRPAPDAGRSGARGSLFRKYFLALFSAVVVPLLVDGGLEAWFGYRDQRARLDELLGAEARAAAVRIQGFVDGIRDQLGWTVQLPWTAGGEERQRFDALRLLRQVPAVVSLTLVDGDGRERLHVSRIGLNRIGAGTDRAAEPAVAGARAARAWYGPVTYQHGSEPFMTLAVAGNRAAVGVAIAEINLKAIWDVISAIRVGRTGDAFVLDGPGRLIAHPDISLVLRGADDPDALPFQALRAAIEGRGGAATIGRDTAGTSVIAAAAPIAGVGWTVVAKQPLGEALAPIYGALWRTAGLLLLGALFAAALAYWLSRRMTGPIRTLALGTERIGAGQFDHRIRLASGDEFEDLAGRFNAMADGLKLSQERSQRIDRLRRFLAPQVAELVDRVGEEAMLEGQRTDVAAIFGDLRGFTAFSARSAPEDVMSVLGAYYGAIGAVVDRHAATLTNIAGDGIMILVGAPVACPEPAARAVALAVALQRDVQGLIARWRQQGHAIGFGTGIAFGPATVGQVDTGSRLDYTAIGPVVNLAARLCAAASDGQILLDGSTADAVGSGVPAEPLGKRSLKGFEREIDVFQIKPDPVELPVA